METPVDFEAIPLPENDWIGRIVAVEELGKFGHTENRVVVSDD